MSELVNSDACPRPTTGAGVRALHDRPRVDRGDRGPQRHEGRQGMSWVGINPIATLDKKLLNMIGDLV